ncbi:MAG: sigma-70 family RNA polymerase sigma factor [Phycisphaerae bacterium]
MIRVTTQPSTRPAMQDWMIPPPYIMNAELGRRATEGRLFREWPASVECNGRLTPSEEILLFKQLHYSGYRLSRLYQSASRRMTARIKRNYSEWIQRYHRIRTRIVEANLGLVYDLIGRSRFETLDRDEMASEGMMALLRATDTFDPWRGFRFSTYACNAILRAFSRAALQETKRRVRIAGPYDYEYEKSDATESSHMEQRALFAERLRRILHLDNADLTDVEKTVLARRFPFDENRPRQTLEDIGKTMQVSKERVRQIQLSAISKLRHAIISDPVLQ